MRWLFVLSNDERKRNGFPAGPNRISQLASVGFSAILLAAAVKSVPFSQDVVNLSLFFEGIFLFIAHGCIFIEKTLLAHYLAGNCLNSNETLEAGDDATRASFAHRFILLRRRPMQIESVSNRLELAAIVQLRVGSTHVCFFLLFKLEALPRSDLRNERGSNKNPSRSTRSSAPFIFLWPLL